MRERKRELGVGSLDVGRVGGEAERGCHRKETVTPVNKYQTCDQRRDGVRPPSCPPLCKHFSQTRDKWLDSRVTSVWGWRSHECLFTEIARLERILCYFYQSHQCLCWFCCGLRGWKEGSCPSIVIFCWHVARPVPKRIGEASWSVRSKGRGQCRGRMRRRNVQEGRWTCCATDKVPRGWPRPWYRQFGV